MPSDGIFRNAPPESNYVPVPHGQERDACVPASIGMAIAGCATALNGHPPTTLAGFLNGKLQATARGGAGFVLAVEALSAATLQLQTEFGVVVDAKAGRGTGSVKNLCRAASASAEQARAFIVGLDLGPSRHAIAVLPGKELYDPASDPNGGYRMAWKASIDEAWARAGHELIEIIVTRAR